MWKLIGKIFVDLVFVTVLYMVSYTNRDSNAILQVKHLRQLFLNTRNSTYHFIQLISIDEYWEWLQFSFITNIRPQTWYNNDPMENMTDYIDDKSNRMIGWATMRQLRLRPNASCEIPPALRSIINSCREDYSLFNEDRHSYAPGWIAFSNVTYSSSIANAFIYRTSTELDSYIYIGDDETYGSGGYVYEFRGNIDDLSKDMAVLHGLSWINQESRAVMIQLNLYNPNVKFYTSVTLLIEISNTGEVFSSASIEPIQMYTEFHDFSSIFYLVIASIYLAFIISMTILEILAIIRLKKLYFHQLGSYIEWCIILCSWSGAGVYIWRYSEAHRIGQYFHQTNGSQYINLQLAVYVNDILTFLLGFCCFFGAIRLLRLFNVFPHVNMFAETLRRASKDIFAFSCMFFLLFFAFVVLFYLLFVSKMFSCSSLLQTSGMLFEMLLLKFNFNEIHNADAFLGPFVFVLFIYFVVFICTTMFVVIIKEHLRYVKNESDRTGDTDPNVMVFILRDVIKRTGLKKLTDEELQEQYDMIMREKYKDPVEQLPEKIDEFFLKLEKACGKCEIIKQSTFISPPHSETKRRRTKRITYSK